MSLRGKARRPWTAQRDRHNKAALLRPLAVRQGAVFWVRCALFSLIALRRPSGRSRRLFARRGRRRQAAVTRSRCRLPPHAASAASFSMPRSFATDFDAGRRIRERVASGAIGNKEVRRVRAGLAAASIDERPGLAIGPGGSPSIT